MMHFRPSGLALLFASLILVTSSYSPARTRLAPRSTSGSAGASEFERVPSPDHKQARGSSAARTPALCVPGSLTGNPPITAIPTADYAIDGMVQFHFRFSGTENVFIDSFFSAGYGLDCAPINGLNTSLSPPGAPLPVQNVIVKAVAVNDTQYVWRTFDEDTGLSTDLDGYLVGRPPESWPVASFLLGHCTFNPTCTFDAATSPAVPVRSAAGTGWPMEAFNSQQIGRSLVIGPARLENPQTLSVPGQLSFRRTTIDAAGNLYVNTRSGSGSGAIHALNPDGTARPGWPVQVTSSTFVPLAFGSPVLGIDGTVYAAIGDSLHARNPDGTARWATPFSPGGALDDFPVIGPGNIIYISGGGGGLHALNPDKTIRWFVYGCGGTPAIAPDGSVFTFMGPELLSTGGMTAINPDGTIRWSLPFEGHNINIARFTTPMLGPNGIVYTIRWFVNEDPPTELFGLDPNTGAIVYRRLLVPGHPGGLRTALGSDGTILVAGFSAPGSPALLGLSPDLATVRFTHVIPAPIQEIQCPPTVGGDGTIYLSLFSRIEALSPAGELLSSYSFPQGNGPIYGGSLAPDGKLYVQTVFGQAIGTIAVFAPVPPAPVITSTAPAQPMATVGNQNLTIYGARFQPGLTVTVTLPDQQTVVLSGDQIRSVRTSSFVAVIDFNGNAGQYSIRVTNPGGVQSNDLQLLVGCVGEVLADVPESSFVGVSVPFVPSSPSCSGSFTYDWDFGDGTSRTSISGVVNHTYEAAGIYPWRLRATPPTGNPVTTRGTIQIRSSSAAALSGQVAIGDEANGRPAFRLNGPEVSVTVTATLVGASKGSSVQAVDGAYAFQSLEPGDYLVTATVEYEDVQGDRKQTHFAVSGSVDVNNPPAECHIVLPPPIVMLHGIRSSRSKWESENSTWDPTARAFGYIVFTPTYGECNAGSQTTCGYLGGIEDRWEATALLIHGVLLSRFTELSTDVTFGRIPKWRAVCHSQGGLVIRALTSGDLRDELLVHGLTKIYLLGTPNSGAVVGLFDRGYYLTEPIIQSDFNKSHPSFGDKPVVVFGGTGGPGLSDGLVNLRSLRHIITRRCLICSEAVGRPFEAGCTRSVLHTHLGNTPTLELLTNYILPDIECPGETGRLQGGSGSVLPGEPYRITSMHSVTLSEAGAVTTIPIPVGPTDRFRIDALDESGGSLLELLDPTGDEIDAANLPPGSASFNEDENGRHIDVLNPVSGTWSIRLTAQGGPCTVSVSSAERSPIGLDAYPASDVLVVGDSATVLASFSEPVGSTLVLCEIVNEAGTVVEELTLNDDGLHDDGAADDGLFGAFSSEISGTGQYRARVRASALSQSVPIQRFAETYFDVRSESQFFTGAFSDIGVDTDDDVILDTIRFSAEVVVPAAGRYSATADLVDASGYAVDHAVASVEASGPGTVTFELEFVMRNVFCVQYGSQFEVRGLELSGGPASAFLDEWLAPVEITALDGNAFNCVPGIPTPKVSSIEPHVIRPNETVELVVNGSSLLAGAVVSCGDSITLTDVVVESPTRIRATASVAVTAGLGPRDVTVMNTDLTVGVGEGFLTISADTAPDVEIAYPLPASVLEASLVVSATVSDDVAIDRVEFMIDGALVGTDLTFPYQYIWDTTVLADSPHAITARAYDSVGQWTEATVPVVVDNCRIDPLADITVETGSQAATCGAAVTFDAPGATAACGPVTCAPAPGAHFPVGTTTVTCSAASGEGRSFTVTVVDSAAPTIVCSDPVMATAPPGQGSVVVTFPAPTASDNCAGVAVSCVPASGSSFTVGVTTVTCTATDAANNATPCQFTVTVEASAAAGVDTAGIYFGSSGFFFLRDVNAPGPADTFFGFGPSGLGWVALDGDWDGDGVDTPGLYDPGSGFFFLRNANTPGPADTFFGFGPGGLGWAPVVGDWDGDGDDTVGLYDPSTGFFFVRNTNTPGGADSFFGFGPGGLDWKPLVGDWDGDGDDTIGLYDPSSGFFFLRNANAPGGADTFFGFGPGGLGWVPLAGDWNGDGADTIGLYDPASGFFFLRNANAPGPADTFFGYGPPGAVPLTGDWNGL
jgi:hypothetical protein